MTMTTDTLEQKQMTHLVSSAGVRTRSPERDSLVTTEVYPAQTPWSLAPVSAPHVPAVWLRMTA